MSASAFTRLLTSQLKQINKDFIFWAFPALVGAGWVIWPAIDYEWKMEMGWAPDPEATINRVQAEKEQRYALKAKSKPAEEEEEEEAAAAAEEEEAPAAEEEEEEEESEEAAAPMDFEDVPAMEDGDEEEEEKEEEEEAEEAPVPPLYLPTKADKLTPQDVWDNFTLKVSVDFVVF